MRGGAQYGINIRSTNINVRHMHATNRGHMEPITTALQLCIYVTGSICATLTPFALAAAITDPQTARRLWRGLWRHLNGLPATGRTITGHATSNQ